MLRAVSFVDASTGFAVGAYSSAGKNMRKTVDGGRTWTEVATGTTKDLYGVYFVDALRGWTMGDSDNSVASLRHTADGGTTWLGDGAYPSRTGRCCGRCPSTRPAARAWRWATAAWS
jgi:photosystem II stability/assembly factor-like uncharacterized protein